MLANGDNPKTVKNLIIKEKITELTFEELFRKWYSVIFESKISAQLILRSFEIHVFPHFGKYPISAITIHNWISLLDKLSKKYSEITKRVLSNARKCYSWAEKRKMVSCNPLMGIKQSSELLRV
ncbi:MAG: phage integrase central domain-containing protein [Candidatus Arsenophonus phytopathogenicus]